MNRYFLFFLFFFSVFIACKKIDKSEPIVPPTVTPPVIVKPQVSAKAFKIDSIRSAVRKNPGYTVVSDSIWADSAGISFKVQVAEDFTDAALSFQGAVNSSVFPGALLQGGSIRNMLYQPFVPNGYKQHPLVIYSTSPSFDPFSTTLIPSLKGTTDFIKNALNTDGKQIESVSYSNGTEFSNYSEISMATRKNWDFSALVIKQPGDHGHIKKKTGFYVNYELSLFNVTVDFPASDFRIFEANIDPATVSGDPLYVNHVTYGRTAILAIESDASFQQIKSAFQNAQNGQERAEDKDLLQKSVITVYMQGFKAGEVDKIQVANGYNRVQLFTKALAASGSYSNTDYGVPVNFYVSKITDISSEKFRSTYHLDFHIK
ncbi:thiol-activated cytolysin family protein [Pedobacter foliorum]|uniref:thiol-activated cytolysin family protein n=1 Tax=Pedobacter foliorum TaxID=2739058 RepID=UPI00156474A6|nr:thiol-activated cytolysin family protein [Pedobacter foliorum]NRF37483.1 thiol-activated cytolysin family protein [Pedobacter foliorum]